eukprot:jgi/Mesen1/8740/ME000052S08174
MASTFLQSNPVSGFQLVTPEARQEASYECTRTRTNSVFCSLKGSDSGSVPGYGAKVSCRGALNRRLCPENVPDGGTRAWTLRSKQCLSRLRPNKKFTDNSYGFWTGLQWLNDSQHRDDLRPSLHVHDDNLLAELGTALVNRTGEAYRAQPMSSTEYEKATAGGTLNIVHASEDWRGRTADCPLVGDEQYEVYVATIPLEVPQGPPIWAVALGNAVFPPLAEHYMTVVKNQTGECLVFDFRPLDPNIPMVAVKVLLGQPVPGRVQMRPLSRPPSKRCWFVSKALPHRDPQSAQEFSQSWDTNLKALRNDCRHYTDALVEHLTGVKGIVSELNQQRFYDGWTGTPKITMSDKRKD